MNTSYKRMISKMLFTCIGVMLVYISFAKNHPYLFYTNEKVEALKERIKKDSTTTIHWKSLLQKADAAINKGKTVDIETVSLVYRVTGDKRYAWATKKLLENMLGRQQWDLLEDRSPQWRSALGTAHLNGQAALAFDAIYDMLTPAERKQMAQRIVVLGIEPSLSEWLSADKRIHTLNSMGHNWWSSIVFKAGIASLAVMNEIPEARGWAEEVMQAADEWFAFSGSVLENKPSSFDPAGGFYESISYANFGIGEYLFFRLAWSNAFGKVRKPYDVLLEKTMDWFIQMCYPTSGKLQSANFGDSSPYANADRPIKLMIALGFHKKRYEWYLSKTSRERFKEDLGDYSPLGLLYSPVLSAQEQEPDLPNAAVFADMGWASLRSSWKENATMLAIKSGYTWNHAHADAGSFILYHNGKNLLIDGGNVNYGNPLYSSYFVRSEAHNVILFNGKAQEPQDQYHAVKNPGHLFNLMDAGRFKYVLADATGPTAHYFLRNFRNVVWIGNVILILDDLKTYEPGKFEFILHSSVDAQKKGIDLEVNDSNAAVLVRPLFPETLPNGYPHDFPEKMRLEERQGVKDHDPKTKLTYYSIGTPDQSQQTKFITAIILLDEKNKPKQESALSNMASAKEMRDALPKIEKLEGKNYIGVRIIENGLTTDVFFNLIADGRVMHRNSHNSIGDWETDAYLFSLSYPTGDDPAQVKNLRSWFVANGSYIKNNKEVLLNSLSKVFLHADMSAAIPSFLLQGQPLIRAGINTGNRISGFQLNGKLNRAEYVGKNLLLLKKGE